MPCQARASAGDEHDLGTKESLLQGMTNVGNCICTEFTVTATDSNVAEMKNQSKAIKIIMPIPIGYYCYHQ